MANTKKLSRPERKKAKRTSRLELKNMYAGLTRKQRAEFSKAEKGIRAFLAEAQKPSE